jgi:hypothetical protein
LPSNVQRQQLRAAITKPAPKKEGTITGVVTADNGDGTVKVAIGGDTTSVSAFTYASYTPKAGDIVHVARKAGHAVVQGKIADQSDVNARKAAAATTTTPTATAATPTAPPKSAQIQGVTAFMAGVVWGVTPPVNTPLIACSGVATVTTSSAGLWSFTLPFTYKTGWAGTVCSANASTPQVSFRLPACTGSIAGGAAWVPTGTTFNSEAFVVCFNLLGA